MDEEKTIKVSTIGWVRPTKSKKSLKVTTMTGKTIGFISISSLERLWYESIDACPLVKYEVVDES